MVLTLNEQFCSDAWSRYWAAGGVSSLPEIYGDPFRGPLADFWRCKLAGLDKGARVLDLGCGNGAVALLAAELAAFQESFWEVHGVDLASINPASTVSGHYSGVAATVTFHPETSMSDTPFRDGYFDLVTGQFAVEYGDPPQVIAEVSRVLRPGGRAFFVFHLKESAVVATARVERAQLEEVLVSGGVFDSALNVLKASTGVATIRDRSAAWNLFAREVMKLDRTARCHDATWPTDTLRDVPADLRDALLVVISEIGGEVDPVLVPAFRNHLMGLKIIQRDRLSRLVELLAVVLDRVGLERVLDFAVRLGLEKSNCEDLRDPNGPLVGCAVTLVKSSSTG